MRVLLMLCLLLVLPLQAHDGHDHDDATALPASVLAPRLLLQSPRLELVAAHEGREWVIYVDDYASNAPLTTLNVQVQQGARQLQAAADGHGSYRVPDNLLVSDGATPSRFLLTGEGWTEQLQGALPAAPAALPITTRTDFMVWIAAVIGSLLALGVLRWWVRRRQRRA